MPIRTILVLLVAAVALSGCGRRGDLQKPGAEAVTSTAPGTAISPLDPGSTGMAPRPEDVQPEDKPDRPFFLDFLL